MEFGLCLVYSQDSLSIMTHDFLLFDADTSAVQGLIVCLIFISLIWQITKHHTHKIVTFRPLWKLPSSIQHDVYALSGNIHNIAQKHGSCIMTMIIIVKVVNLVSLIHIFYHPPVQTKSYSFALPVINPSLTAAQAEANSIWLLSVYWFYMWTFDILFLRKCSDYRLDEGGFM